MLIVDPINTQQNLGLFETEVGLDIQENMVVCSRFKSIAKHQCKPLALCSNPHDVLLRDPEDG